MSRIKALRVLGLLVAVGVVGLTGCMIRPTRPTVEAPQPVYVTQPAPVVVSQPAPVVVSRPAPVVVYRRATYTYTPPPPVVRPVRYYSPYVASARVCVPGTSRVCEAYCGSGIQYCNADGYSWGQCIESHPYYYPYDY